MEPSGDMFSAFAQYGLAGLIIFLLGMGVHFWTSRVWDYLTNSLLPKYWEMMEKKIERDQEYRMAHTQKMDSMIDTTNDTRDKVKENTEVLRTQVMEFGKLTTELRELTSTLKEN